MRSLRGRLAKLEEAARPPAGRCPHCPPLGPIPIVEVDQHGNLLSGAYPPRCARCGGPHDGIRGMRFIQVVLPRDGEAGAGTEGDNTQPASPEGIAAGGR